MKKITLPKVSIGFAVVLAILLANISIADRNISRIVANNRAELRSEQLSLILVKILLALKDAEISQREYLLTKNYSTFQVDRVQQTAKIQQLVRSLPDWQKLTKFKQTIESNLTELTTIEQQHLRTLASGGQIQLSTRERQIIPSIRQQIVDFDRAEKVFIDQARSESRSSLASARITLIISVIVDLILLSLLYSLVMYDRSKQQKIELKLRDYSAELEELYHNAPCGYHSVDEMGNFIRINRTELKMLGYEETEIVNSKKLIDLLTPASKAKFHNLLPQLKSTGAMHDLEFEMIRKNGSIIPVSATANLVYQDSNSFTIKATIIDVSERIHAQQQSQLSAEIAQKIRTSLELDQIFQATTEGMQQLFDVDRVLIFELAPDGSGIVIAERVGSDYQSVVGSKIFDPCFTQMCHESYKQGRISAVADITNAGFQSCYIEFLQQFGVQAVVTSPIHLRDELWGLLIIHHCRSTREWKHQEIELMSQFADRIGMAIAQSRSLEQERHQRQELIRSNAELEQFAYVCSHDLQEPLRMVTSYLQLLSSRYQGKLDADADEFIDYAVDGAVRMQALIQGLLGYARLSSQIDSFTIVNGDRVLSDAISNLQVAISQSGAIITSESLPNTWGDATQLTQLFQNLIANAIKFRGASPPQIHIGVRAINPPDPTIPSKCCFSVADNGIGIESEYLGRIFAIFQRLHSRATYPGTGIGLAICKKIVERHGGKIWVESTPNQGTIFYFILNTV
jgi:PAS domain S-box-containing protein